MTKDEYYAAFPHDEYNDENNMYKWDRGEKVYEASFDTHNRQRIFHCTNYRSWKPGIYVLEAHTKDKYGEDVKDIKYFTVYSDKESAMPNNSLDWFTVD